tara:strand:- start:56 stop:247 length:192 start_codon:yes stop_codon:yes gene_type:complete
MNKAAAAGIGIVVILIAVSVLFMLSQYEDSDMQIGLSDGTESEEPKSYEVNITEELDVGDVEP